MKSVFYTVAILALWIGGYMTFNHPYWAVLPMTLGIGSLLVLGEKRWSPEQ